MIAASVRLDLLQRCDCGQLVFADAGILVHLVDRGLYLGVELRACILVLVEQPLHLGVDALLEVVLGLGVAAADPGIAADTEGNPC